MGNRSLTLKRFAILASWIFSVILFVITPAGYCQIPSGTILVSDADGGTGGLGVIYEIDPLNGNRTTFSDFGDNTQGPLGADPWYIAIAPNGDLVVTDYGAGTGGNGALFIVNPDDGSRTLLSDFGDNTQGPLGSGLVGVAVSDSNQIFVSDHSAGTGGLGAIFQVDAASGNRTIVSDLGNGAQGPTGGGGSLVIDGSGNILMTDSSGGTGALGALLSIDPTTGNRTLISDFGNNAQGDLGDDPFDVALGAGGVYLVIDDWAGTGSQGALFSVNPATGDRSVISDFGNAAQGPLGGHPWGMTVASNGVVLATAWNAGTGNQGALFMVNPTNGARTLISDFGDSGQGPVSDNPFGVVIISAQAAQTIPTLNEWGTMLFILFLALIALSRLRKFGNRVA